MKLVVTLAVLSACGGSSVVGNDNKDAATDSSSDVTSPVDADPSDAVDDVSSDSGVWTSPKDIPNLVVWLDDTVGLMKDAQNPAHVTTWLDQSGKNNHAVAVANGNQLDPNAIGGHDAIRCLPGGTLGITDSPSLHFGTGAFGIALIVKYQYSTTMNGDYFFSQQDSIGSPTQGIAIGNFQGDAPGLFDRPASVAATKGSAQPDQFTTIIARGPAPLELRVGGAVFSGSTVTTPSLNHDIILCTNQSGGGPYYEIAEVIVVNGKLSDADVTHLSGYFKKKFGI